MDGDRIQSIISYIQQNPDVSTELLMQNLIQAGYNIDELKEALRKLDISPIVIPGYKEPDPVPHSTSVRLPVIILAVFLLLIVVGGVFLVLYLTSSH